MFPTCIKIQLTQLAEPLINYELSYDLWQKVGADFTDWYRKGYLIIRNYFSKDSFLYHMNSTMACTVIDQLSEVLA